MAKLSKFGAAFKAARAAGKKEFSFGGKKYNTKVKGEGESKKIPTPSAAPRVGQDKASGGRQTTSAKSGASRSTEGKTALTERAKRRGQQGPSPAKAVGMAKAGSGISKIKARAENAPKKEAQDYPRPAKAVGIARAGSKIGQAAARKENEPKKKK